jgi:hypothetical protein
MHKNGPKMTFENEPKMATVKYLIDVLESYIAYTAHSHGHVDYIAWLLAT